MTESVQISVNEVRAALQNDAEFFIHFFLQDELTHPVPPFHIDVFHLMTHADVERFVCAIPRDHAKTTLAKLACVWYFLFSEYQFIVYLSNTAEIAIPAVNDIVAFIESDNFKSVFGAVEWQIKRDGEGVYKFFLPSLQKTCILRALGAGKQVRGINIDNKRPQLAVIDDLEDADNIATERLFNKLKQWLYGTFFKAMDKFGHKIIQLGNIVVSPCLLTLHCSSKFWFSRHYGCLLANGEPLWPDAWPVYKLTVDFERYQEAGQTDTWFAEMMNLPVPPGGGLIAAKEITYQPEKNPEDLVYGFLTVDLAISEETWAHRTVVCVHGYDADVELWQIVEYKYWTGIDPVRLFYEIVDLAMKWGFYHIGIESVAFQASLKHVYRHMALTEAKDFLHWHDLPAVRKKVHRLAAWAAMLKRRVVTVGDTEMTTNGQYALTYGDFMCTQQLLTFNPTKKHNDDDIADAAAHGVTMIAMYISEIMRQIRPESEGSIQTIGQISAV